MAGLPRLRPSADLVSVLNIKHRNKTDMYLSTTKNKIMCRPRDFIFSGQSLIFRVRAYEQKIDFNLDRSEYQQVFKVFDKANSGEISIQQVYEYINKFDAASI